MFTFSHITRTSARSLALLATAALVAGGPATAIAAAECCPTGGDVQSVIPAGQPGGPTTPPPAPASLPPGEGGQSVIPAGQPGAPESQPPLPPGIGSGGSQQSVIPAGQPGASTATSVMGLGQPGADGRRAPGGRAVSLRRYRNGHSTRVQVKKHRAQRRSVRLGQRG